MRVLHILFFVLMAFIESSRAEDELVAVSLLYRHGDRTPLDFYPNDPHKNSSVWSAPPGELTNIGKMQLFELGKWLRSRYDKFLSSEYKKNEIFARSSDNDRCLMSAASMLAGLYQPQGKDVWNKDIQWQPIPIHTMEPEEDDIAEVESACPKYLDLFWKTAAENSYPKQINEKNKSLYKFLTEKSGQNISEVEGAYDLFDILNIEKMYNLTLPTWAVEVYPKLEEIGDIAYKLFTLTPKLEKLFVGRYFDNLLAQFRYISNELPKDNGQRERKFKTFSVHDLQVYGVLDAIKVENLKKVPYAAAVIFELRKSQQGETYVKTFYKMKKDVADLVKIQECELNCGLLKFIGIIEKLSLTKLEYKNECQ